MQGKDMEMIWGVFELFFKGWLGKDSEDMAFEKDLHKMSDRVVVDFGF